MLEHDAGEHGGDPGDRQASSGRFNIRTIGATAGREDRDQRRWAAVDLVVEVAQMARRHAIDREQRRRTSDDANRQLRVGGPGFGSPPMRKARRLLPSQLEAEAGRLGRRFRFTLTESSWSFVRSSYHRGSPGTSYRGSTLTGMLDHLSIQCADVAASAAFYDAVLAPLGGAADHGLRRGHRLRRAAEARLLDRPADDRRAASASRTSPSRRADRAAVRAFFDAAVAAGAEVLHEPRVWPEYHPNYYGAFVRDPDGNNVEAVCHSPELEPS